MESLEWYRELVRGCARCFSGGRNTPVVDAAKDVRVLLVGQAPGLTEVTTRLPFTGPADRRLEGWFSEAVGETFERDGVVYVPLPHFSGASTWLEQGPSPSRARGVGRAGGRR